MEKITSPPACIRGMKELDKDKFLKKIQVPLLSIDVNLVHSVINTVKRYLLKMDKIKQVYDDPDSGRKLIYLDPNLVKDFESFDDKHRELLRNYGLTPDNLVYREITIGYDNWSTHEVINCIIPENTAFSGFTQTGKIIHVNLKPELLPYKHVIGKVLLEKVKNCESVVNKIQSIDNVYRTFNLEVLAGSDDLCTVVNENGCKFELDFKTVYWNSRLHEEHHEIVSKLNKGDVLYDVFCGIGPFAIPAAKKGCIVLANDANPESCKYLQRNKYINKVKLGLEIFNKDGADFIKQHVKQDMLRRSQNFNPAKPYSIHITMNLPAIAYTFLTNFIGLFTRNELSSYPDQLLPVVHLYCFVPKNADAKDAAKSLVEATLKYRIENENVFPQLTNG
ncbi:tRNA (guanine(37)-N1)-methyltransferase isoform X3 [Planococcus citri]|uniref:tRNA (guanine(37)-N1)-methyltransferase isoform X3 n=1 Tax=Planococcus citri TaxID=170843 RepID=UPI0031F887C0